jgi:hypothetical protein
MTRFQLPLSAETLFPREKVEFHCLLVAYLDEVLEDEESVVPVSREKLADDWVRS